MESPGQGPRAKNQTSFQVKTLNCYKFHLSSRTSQGLDKRTSPLLCKMYWLLLCLLLRQQQSNLMQYTMTCIVSYRIVSLCRIALYHVESTQHNKYNAIQHKAIQYDIMKFNAV